MKTTPTLERVVDAIQETVIKELLTVWRINREITTEKLSAMTYRQLRSQLGPKSIHRLYLECWSTISPDMAWMKDHERKREKRLSPIEVTGYSITYQEVRWAEIEASVKKIQVLATPSIKLLLKKFRKKGETQQGEWACERADDVFPSKLPEDQRLHPLFLINQRLQFDGVHFRFKFMPYRSGPASTDLVEIVARNR